MQKKQFFHLQLVLKQLESGIMPDFYQLMEVLSELSIVLTEPEIKHGHSVKSKKSVTCDPNYPGLPCLDCG